MPEHGTNGDASASSPGVDPRFRGKRYRQLVAGFNVYRSSPTVAASIGPPRLHTIYRGVPFSADAPVLEVRPRDVVLSVARPQLDAVARTGTSLIASPVHGTTFLACATEVDLDDSRAAFAQLVEQRRRSADLRGRMRVEPGEDVEVRVRRDGADVSGTLVDLSVVSLAIRVHGEHLADESEGTPVDVAVPTFPGAAPGGFEATGHIIRTIPLIGGDPEAHGLVVYLRVDDSLHARLEKYVEGRRAEIVEELSRDA